MCTSIKYKNCVGRNLDIYQSYGKEVVITPRRYPFYFRKEKTIHKHYAILGMGAVSEGYPLYFDAINEHGLYMAGLNYVGNAKYHEKINGKINLAPYELIPYVLSCCESVRKAEGELAKINLIDLQFSSDLATAELHWMIADKERAITVEPDENGIKVYNNPLGVLTNNPPFPYQMLNLSNYSSLSPKTPENTSFENIELNMYSEGMGAIGLPGDLSSTSRFIRAAFHKSHARGDNCVNTLFHLLLSVAMPDGSVIVESAYERTEYTSVADLLTATYYYLSYEGSGICEVKLSRENLDTSPLIRYPFITDFSPKAQN